MRPIIFVRVADMKYYQGITDSDQPFNGGSFVKETGMAHECYNFDPVIQEGEEYEKCLGFFMPIGNRVSQLHIEKVPGCSAMKKAESIDGVTVVFVSKSHGSSNMRVVGFYKNAIAYRYPHGMTFENGYVQEYFFEARKENCVVLPYQIRFSSSAWFVPRSSSEKSSFGFGRANVWYAGGSGASEEELQYVEKMIVSIDNYCGENWMGRGGV